MGKVVILDDSYSEEEKLAKIEEALELAKLIGLLDDEPIDEWC